MHNSIKSILTMSPVMPVLVINKVDKVEHLFESLIKGNLKVVEVTLRTPCALKVIEIASKKFPSLMVGAGTVLNEKIRNARIIELVPVISLAAFASSTILFTSITATTIAGKIGVFIVNTIIMSVISFGISFLVNKLLSPKDPKQVKTSSFIFSSKDNVTNRNTPVPVSYGRLRIGSHVISSLTLNFDLALRDIHL